ncbi:MAG: hypothetical protein GEU79_13390 [Acidimicrobiia bacterium]|nr:hypothetical protein [Acidimicrobiia bacterium]
MNWRQLAITQGLRATRTGNRGGLVLAAIMFLLSMRGNRKGERKLIYSASVPIGSSVVVRHNPGGEPEIDVVDPRGLTKIDPETGETL